MHRVASRPDIFGLGSQKKSDVGSREEDGNSDVPIDLMRLKEFLHYEDMFGCVCRNLGKGFVVGFAGSCFAEALRLAVSMLGGRSSRGNPLIVFAKRVYRNRYYSLRWGMFASLNLTFYNAWMFCSRNYERKIDRGKLWRLCDDARFRHVFLDSKNVKTFLRYVDHYRGAIGGALCGLALLCLHESTRPTMALFAAIRAFEMAVKMLVRRRVLPDVPYADVLLMSAASAQLMHAFVFEPTILGDSYRKFLERQVQYDLPVVRAIADMARGRRPLRPAAARLLNSPNYDTSAVRGTELLTGNRHWLVAMALYWLNGFKIAVPVYLPVFTLPVVLFVPGELVRDPLASLRRILGGVAQSSSFLSTYCTIGISTVIICRRLGLRHNIFGALAESIGPIAGAMCGVAVVLDKKSRRSELALFVFAHSVTSCWIFLKRILNRHFRFDGSPISRYGDVALFSISMSIIMHAFTRHSGMIRRTYASIMRRLFDSESRNHFFKTKRVATRTDADAAGGRQGGLS